MTKASSVADLDVLFADARQQASALTLALRTQDNTNTMVSSARLRHTLRLMDAAAAENLSASHRRLLLEMLASSTSGMRRLLGSVPQEFGAIDHGKLQRWLHAQREHRARSSGPHLFGVDAAGNGLQGASFFGIHVSQSRFITDLSRASFIESHVESTDFDYSQMCGTIWQRTSIHCSYLRQTSFVDSTFVDVTFSGCDLRGADFSAAEIERLPVADIHFVDCDLRDTRWLGRDMSSVVFGNCRTHGMIEGAWASYLSKAHVSGRECRPSAALRSVRCLATPVHISVRDA